MQCGRGMMSEPVVKTGVVDQNLEPLILYLPTLMADPADRIGRDDGFGKRGTPRPVRTLAFGVGFQRTDNSKGAFAPGPGIKPLLVPALIENRTLVFDKDSTIP